MENQDKKIPPWAKKGFDCDEFVRKFAQKLSDLDSVEPGISKRSENPPTLPSNSNMPRRSRIVPNSRKPINLNTSVMVQNSEKPNNPKASGMPRNSKKSKSSTTSGIHQSPAEGKNIVNPTQTDTAKNSKKPKNPTVVLSQQKSTQSTGNPRSQNLNSPNKISNLQNLSHKTINLQNSTHQKTNPQNSSHKKTNPQNSSHKMTNSSKSTGKKAKRERQKRFPNKKSDRGKKFVNKGKGKKQNQGKKHVLEITPLQPWQFSPLQYKHHLRERFRKNKIAEKMQKQKFWRHDRRAKPQPPCLRCVKNYNAHSHCQCYLTTGIECYKFKRPRMKFQRARKWRPWYILRKPDDTFKGSGSRQIVRSQKDHKESNGRTKMRAVKAEDRLDDLNVVGSYQSPPTISFKKVQKRRMTRKTKWTYANHELRNCKSSTVGVKNQEKEINREKRPTFIPDNIVLLKIRAQPWPGEDVIKIFDDAVRESHVELIKFTLEFIAKHASFLIKTETFWTMSGNALQLVLEQNSLVLLNELELFIAVVNWGLQRCRPDYIGLEKVLSNPMKLIQFSSMNVKQLERIVIPFKYFDLNQLKWVLICCNSKKGNLKWSPKNYFFPKNRNYVDPDKLPVLTAASINSVRKNCTRLAKQALESPLRTIEVSQKIPVVRPNNILQYSSFDNMGLKSEILQRLTALDIKFPNLIQQYAIFPCLQGLNVLIKAPSNSETVAYIIAILNNIDLTKQHCQTLIVIPSKGFFIEHVFQEFAKFPEVSVVDAENLSKKTREQKIKAGFHVLIGTLASIPIWINCKFVELAEIKILVLDGADDLSLMKQHRLTIQHMFEKLHHGAPQTILVAEKSSSQLTSLSLCLGNNFVHISKENCPNFHHFYQICANNSSAADNKMNNLRTILKQIPRRCSKIVIFCNSDQNEGALRLGRRFNKRRVFFISKISSRAHHQQVISEFEVKGGILILRDRHLEIQPPKCSLLINFDLPIKFEDYMQKLNCLAPADGNKAVLSLVTVNELFSLCEFLKKHAESGQPWNAADFRKFHFED